MTTKKDQDIKNRLRKKTVAQQPHRFQLRSKGSPVVVSPLKKPKTEDPVTAPPVYIPTPSLAQLHSIAHRAQQFQEWETFAANFEYQGREGVTYIPPHSIGVSHFPGRVLTGTDPIVDHFNNRTINTRPFRPYNPTEDPLEFDC